MDNRSYVYEAMRQRRKRTWDAIAEKERRREEEAIFRLLEDRKGDDHETK